MVGIVALEQIVFDFFCPAQCAEVDDLGPGVTLQKFVIVLRHLSVLPGVCSDQKRSFTRDVFAHYPDASIRGEHQNIATDYQWTTLFGQRLSFTGQRFLFTRSRFAAAGGQQGHHQDGKSEKKFLDHGSVSLLCGDSELHSG